MREKLATIDPEAPETAQGIAFTTGHAGDAGCERCVAELVAAGEGFDKAFGDRDYEGFIDYFYDENATGLGADGTVGMNRDAWGRILKMYFEEPLWTLTVTPIKSVVQGHDSGQILEVVRFDAPDKTITFVHVTVWLRKHGQWKVTLQTEAGPLEDTEALLANVAAQTAEAGQ